MVAVEEWEAQGMSSSIKADRSPNQRITGIVCTPIILDGVSDGKNHCDSMNVIPRNTRVTVIIHQVGSDNSNLDRAEVSAIATALSARRRITADILPPACRRPT